MEPGPLKEVESPRETIRPCALLLTGRPGIGKTTVVRRVADRLAGHAIGGFLTEEVREEGRRIGFRLRTFGSRVETTLAHLDFRSPHRVGRYGVDVAALDEVVGDALRLDAGRDVFLVDEIGKMECCSARFVEAMETLLDSGLCVVATISDHGGGFIARTRSRADLALWRVTLENRDALTERVLAWIGRTPHTRGER